MLKHGLEPIVCVGETLAEREAGRGLRGGGAAARRAGWRSSAHDDGKRLVIAYEPVWAIGTGRTATPAQAQEVHAFIRGKLAEQFGDVAEQMRIQYGGSVKPDNASLLMDQADIDGALVGGASLKADDFLKIVKYRNS